jgi:hypothetical protein
MTNENQENTNTLASWATGKVAMFAIGLAVGIFLYKAGILQKVTGKLFSKKESE